MTANTLTIGAARDALRKREISAVDLTMSCLTAIDAADGLNAFVHKTPEIALEQARAADARLASGDAPAMCGRRRTRAPARSRAPRSRTSTPRSGSPARGA